MKAGVLGGTFDPIHIGHVHLAGRTRKLFGLAKVYFVVAASPPHKPPDAPLPFSHRFAMVTLATAGHPAFVSSQIELEPPASPFTIHTLAKLARRYRYDPRDLCFIAGGDSLLDVATWHESAQLLTSYNFIFVCRPGVRQPDASAVLPREAVTRVRDLRGLGPRQLLRRIELEKRARAGRIFIIDVSAPDISATRIRLLASAGQRIRHLVPPFVNEYIDKQQIYGG